ncbi:hypothetical protein IID10_17230, partial [candidate division KSB1 bacterium]|nr:hypothetical protein [candidate division KSB1 bacterium]
ATILNLAFSGNSETQEYKRAILELREILKVQAKAGNQASRLLNMMKSFSMNPEEIEEFLTQVTQKDPALLRRIGELNIDDPAEIKKVFNRLDHIGRNFRISMIFNNLLSSPVTATRNLADTILHVLTLIPVRGIATLIESTNHILFGKTQKLYLRESEYLLTGMIGSVFRGDRLV